MSYTIEFKEEEGYYRVTKFGEDSLAEHIQIRNELLVMAGPKPGIKVLTDFFNSRQTNMNKQEQFYLTQDYYIDGSLTEMTIAMVLPEEAKAQDDWYFIMSMTRPAGVNVKAFYTEEEALAWLLAR